MALLHPALDAHVLLVLGFLGGAVVARLGEGELVEARLPDGHVELVPGRAAASVQACRRS